MKKYLLLLVLLIPFNIKAQCSYERLAELSKEAGNVQISYSYTVSDNRPSFNIDVSNLRNDLYMIDNYGGYYTSDITTNPVTGLSISFDIYSNDSNCRDEKLTTKYLKIPDFNMYSTTDECKNNTKEVCQIWTNTNNLSEEEFNNRLKSTNKIVKEKNVKKKENKFDYKILLKILIIIISIFLIFGIIILIVRRSRRK